MHIILSPIMITGLDGEAEQPDILADTIVTEMNGLELSGLVSKRSTNNYKWSLSEDWSAHHELLGETLEALSGDWRMYRDEETPQMHIHIKEGTSIMSNMRILVNAIKEMKRLGYYQDPNERNKRFVAMMHSGEKQHVIIEQNEIGGLEYYRRLSDEEVELLLADAPMEGGE